MTMTIPSHRYLVPHSAPPRPTPVTARLTQSVGVVQFLPVGLLIAYAHLIALTPAAVGATLMPLAAIPVIAAAGTIGLRAGVLVAILIAALHASVFGQRLLEAGWIVNHLVLLLIAAGIARVRSLEQRARSQATDLAALAAERETLLNAEARRAQQREALIRLTPSLLEAGNQDELLAAFARSVRRLVPCEHSVAVYLLGYVDGHPMVRPAFADGPPAASILSRGSETPTGLIGAAIASRSPQGTAPWPASGLAPEETPEFTAADAPAQTPPSPETLQPRHTVGAAPGAAAPAAQTPPAGAGATTSGHAASLALPLLGRHGPIGVALLSSIEYPSFTADDADTAALYCNQAALALENLWLSRHAAETAALHRLGELKDELLRTVSHELRTPLTYIFGYSELLSRSSAMPKRELQMADQIHRAADHMRRLVDDLMELDRLSTGNIALVLDEVPVGALLRRAVDTVARSEGHEPLVRFEIATDLPLVMVDPDRIHQVMVNVLTNAVRYSHEQTTITVGAVRREADVEVWVRDHGAGLTEEQRERIFEKFYRGDVHLTGKHPGAGLGLPISRGLVEAHGGRMWAESAGIGKGATVRFTLPMAETASPGAARPQGGSTPTGTPDIAGDAGTASTPDPGTGEGSPSTGDAPGKSDAEAAGTIDPNGNDQGVLRRGV